MTNYRILLLSFLTISWVFLSGLNQPVDNDVSTEETQKTEFELKAIETENNARKQQETKQENVKGRVKPAKADTQKIQQTTDSSDADDKSPPIKGIELEKHLDLSLPYKDSDNAELKIEQKPAAQSQVTNIFAPETKKKAQPLELDGDFLMSPEPEAEKLKSVDGAGIVIKLKR